MREVGRGHHPHRVSWGRRAGPADQGRAAGDGAAGGLLGGRGGAAVPTRAATRPGAGGRHRGAAAHRARAARRGRAQHVADRGPGRRGRPRDPHRPGRRRALARGHRRHQPARARADPVDAGDAARARARTGPGHPPWVWRTCRRWSGTSGRPGWTSSWSGRATAATVDARGLAGGVPDRAGVADQRDQALRGSSSAKVAVRVTGDVLDLDISDPGPARATARVASAGHGLTGLDERARLIGRHGDPRRGRRRLPRARDPARRGRPMTGSTIRVAVVDDQDLVRAGFVLLLRLGRGHRGGGGGARRVGGRVAVPSYGAGRGADGRPDAAPRRPGRHPDDPRGPGLPADPDPGADDLRGGRPGPGGVAVRGERLPGQGHPTRPAARGHRGRRRQARRCCTRG